MNAIEVDQLNTSFFAMPVLRGVSLQVPPASVLGLIGPNGAGKSTLIRAIVGRLKPDHGEVRIYGKPVRSDAAARRSLGWVPQVPALYPQLTTRENLETFGTLHGLASSALRPRVDKVLEWAGLTAQAAQKSSSLSVGERNRLNMGVGILHRPKVLLLDEPTAGVDPQSRQRMYEMVDRLRRHGTTVVFTTHFIEEAERLCNRVVIINHGCIVGDGTPQELVDRVAGDQSLVVIESAPLTATLGQRLAARGVSCHITGAQARMSDINGNLGELLSEFSAEKVEIRNLLFRKPSLESVFLQLTGQEMRA